MKNTHTPGPWAFDPETSRVFDADLWYVAEIDPEYASGTEANARLIAAAPDLLAALVRIASEGLDLRTLNAYDAHGFANIARAAIAKATGE